MLLKLLLTLFLISGIFMRAMPHEAESGQDTIYRRSAAIPPHKTISGKFIHNHILNPGITTVDYNQEYLEKKPLPYHRLEGKIIRRIYIRLLDPFGYSLQDTSLVPVQLTKKVGNALHVITRERVIRNLMLIHEHQPFDSLLFKESERLIRAQKYVQDVVAYTSISSQKVDSLDIYIRIIDIWSIIPTLRKTGQMLQAGLADNNLLGTGNRLQVDTRYAKNITSPVIQAGYTISNIGNTHITGSFQYYFSGDNDLVNNQQISIPTYSSLSYNLPTLNLSNRYLVKSIELYRPFFSPLTRWAGGLFWGQLVTRQNYIEKDSVRYLASITHIQDYWGAVSFPLSTIKGLAGRTSSIIVSARLLKTRYPHPVRVLETISLFDNENFYFAGIGITSRSFIRDRYVFNYGKIEDIPVGRAFGITTGFHVQKNNQFYLGLKAAWGNNYTFGYLSSVMAYGTYIGWGGFSQQVISARANYYTRLFKAGYWRIRQFIKPTVTVGINRLPTDNLTPGSIMEGIEDLKNPATRMMALTLQTQSYAPWEIYGFRFGPYFFSSLGLLSHADVNSRNHFYSALGLGVLIKNNYLLINTFQVSFTFYPSLPLTGHSVLELNAYKTSDYGLIDFEIAKPQVVDYR
ncbi:MAG: hypothetical protein ACM3P1_04055 [Candidatus Saccharibacteria bacterium]